jgi:hypothetical protein
MTEKAGRFWGVHSPDPDIFIMMGLHAESIGETKKTGESISSEGLVDHRLGVGDRIPDDLLIPTGIPDHYKPEFFIRIDD